MRDFRGERLSMMVGNEFELSYIPLPKNRNVLNDVWYKAIVETKPLTNPKSRLRELYVRLLKDDFRTPLDELKYDKNVIFRPTQPTCLKDRLNITIGSIVEADYKNAWWTGFVVKEIDEDKYLVCFDSLLSDIILFERKHLRSHLELRDTESSITWWAIASKRNHEFLRRLAEEPMFSPGTMVEVNTKLSEVEDFWVPCMIIKEIKEEDDEYKYLVKVCKEVLECNGRRTLQKTADLRSLRPRPPHSEVQEYQLEEFVDAFYGMGWRQARVVENEVRVMGSASQKWCLVRFEATKKEYLIKISDVRPSKVWEDGVWKTRESPLTQGSGDKLCDSAMNEKESDSSVIPPSGIIALPLKDLEAETQRKTFPKKTLVVKNSTQENGNNKVKNRKRKRKENLSSVACLEEHKAKGTT